MNCPLISIIVPVYQVEKYLEKCINSIINQTYKNLEIILVDDGSTDNSPAICDCFQRKDTRIKVIHQENGGLSHARNVGLEIATGDFIGFVDSDDWVETNMYEVLMSALQETGADIAVCDRFIDFEDSPSKSIDIKYSEVKIHTGIETLKNILKGGKINDTVWNKLYKLTVLINIFFLEEKIHEDILWTSQVIGQARFVVYIDYPLYHYLQRNESLSRNNNLFVKRGLDKIEILKKQLEYIHVHYPSLVKFAIMRFQNICCWEYIIISQNKDMLDSDGRIRRELHRLFCQSTPIIVLNSKGLFTTMGRILFRFSPNLLVKTYIFLKNIFR